MKKWKNVCMGICLLALCMGMTVFAEEATILKGVTIDGVDVSGMNRREAVQALEAHEAKIGAQKVTLKIGEETVETDLTAFGLSCSSEEAVDEALGIGRVGNIVKRYKDQKDLQHGGREITPGWEADRAQVKAFLEGMAGAGRFFGRDGQYAGAENEDHGTGGERGAALGSQGSSGKLFHQLFHIQCQAVHECEQRRRACERYGAVSGREFFHV